MYSMYVGKITETQLTFKRFIFYEVQNTSKFTSVIIFYIHFCCPKTKKKNANLEVRRTTPYIYN